MSENIEKTPEARWKLLRENGRKLLLDLKSNDKICVKPSWFDEDKFARAKSTIQKYYIGIRFSSFTGLLLILQLPEGLEPLLTTGNSKDIPSLYKRYLGTMLHVNSWYDDDVFDPDTKGYKSIRQVRAMHRRLQQIMNERFQVKSVEVEPRLWMNQYDVALTQFAFIGMAMLFPGKCAMVAATKEELGLINYYWRVLGFLMGLEDDYNLCQFDDYKDIYEFNRLIFEHEYKDTFNKYPCKTGLEMSKGICLALKYFSPWLTFNMLANWWKDCFHFNGYEPQPMTIREKLFNFWTDVSFNRLLKYEGFMSFSNKLHKKRFEEKLKKRDKVYEGLKKKYKDSHQMTFYSDRVNYFPLDKQQEIASPEEKQIFSNVCPFGYEVSLPTASPLEQTVAS